jgi:hypothetical protein
MLAVRLTGIRWIRVQAFLEFLVPPARPMGSSIEIQL